MGGRSAGGRDRIMENLIADHIAEASTAHTAIGVADASPAETAGPRAEPAAAPPTRARPTVVAQAKLQRVTATTGANAAGEGDDAAGDEEGSARQPMLKAPAPRAAQPTAADLGLLKSPAGAKPSAKIQARLAAASALTMPPLGRPQNSADDDRRPALASRQGEESDGPAAHGGWTIQIGAPDNPAKANALLIRARERNPSTLASAKLLTEKVRKGDATLYRARFAVLDSASAEAACRSLKRTGFSCFPAHD
jgi:D-alanyl-D-alanine carboxypeptidase